MSVKRREHRRLISSTLLLLLFSRKSNALKLKTFVKNVPFLCRYRTVYNIEQDPSNSSSLLTKSYVQMKSLQEHFVCLFGFVCCLFAIFVCFSRSYMIRNLDFIFFNFHSKH